MIGRSEAFVRCDAWVRLVARSQRKTLNAAFLEWLLQFTAQSGNGQEVDSLMKRLRHINANTPGTR